MPEIMIGGVPSNLHAIIQAAKAHCRQTNTDIGGAFSYAIARGLDIEVNSPLRFQHVFTDALQGKTCRFAVNDQTIINLEKIMKLCVLSKRHATLTALSRSCLNRDGNILAKTILYHLHTPEMSPLPLPPAIDGPHTAFIGAPSNIAAE